MNRKIQFEQFNKLYQYVTDIIILLIITNLIFVSCQSRIIPQTRNN